MAVSSINAASIPAFVMSAKRAGDGSATDNATNSTTPSNSVSQLDFSHMTPAAMLDTMNSLIKSGQMSLDESSSLIGVLPIRIDGSDSGEWNQPMDFFDALKQQKAYNDYSHNDSGSYYSQLALNALTRLQGRITGADVTA